MGKKHIDHIGAWAIAAFLTLVVCGPVIYLLNNTEVNNEEFPGFGTVMSQKQDQTSKVSDGKTEAKLSGDFGYEGTNGPKFWSQLQPEYYACSSGSEQSPINIDKSVATVTSGVMRTQYRPHRVRIMKTENRLLTNYQSGYFENGDNVKYYTQAIDFHTPSEHALSGKHYDLEMQIEHVSENGRMSRVSVLFKPGKENKHFAKLLQSMPDENNRPSDKVNLNVVNLLPKKLDYYHYLGSLTIPPCSEGVSWYVLQNPVEVSNKQLERIIDVLRFNARPLQNKNDRQVTMSN